MLYFFRLSVLVLFLYTSLSNAQECHSMDYQITSEHEIIYTESPGYPNFYQPGTQCRHRITAPMDHVITITCYINIVPNSCDSEYFLISPSGDYEFRDAETVCSSTQVTRNSDFRSLTLAYISARSNTTQRGRFSCSAIARKVSCNCGWSINTRITNGQEAMPNEFPSVVALKDVRSIQRIFCGGNIISRRHILTAAHCTTAHPDPSQIIAYAGYHDLTSDTASPFSARYRIESIINHPDYSPTAGSANNDIALLKTKVYMEWSPGVGPICLPWRRQSDPFTFERVDVAGWGTLTFAGSKSNTLQKANLMILDNAVCQNQYNDRILASQICTFDYRGLGQDSCQYDSGGPLMLRRRRLILLGIISYGSSCGQQYGIGINTRITYYLSWLWRYTQNDVCALE